MKLFVPLVASMVFAATTFAATPNVTVITFEKTEAGKTPMGFTAALTGQGKEGVWIVQQDTTSPAEPKVLAQTSDDPTNNRFPVCVYDELVAKDVEVSVAFKCISGQKDQAAGIVWRYKDKDNYYIVRANALEDNVVAYKMQDGKRADLKIKGKPAGYGMEAKVHKGEWNTLKISATGDLFTITLNDKKLFEVEDGTFPTTGKVGLWTKADSVTEFDNLRIVNLDAKD